MSGNFTHAQRQIVKSCCQIDVQNFNNVYQWLKENNPNFINKADSNLCPTPILLEDDASSDEDPVNPGIENEINIQYQFPNNGGPNSSNSVFSSQSEFIDALIKAKEPTLLFTSKNYQADYRLTLPSVFPLHFFLEQEELKS